MIYILKTTWTSELLKKLGDTVMANKESED